jgi:hypothetical protein
MGAEPIVADALDPSAVMNAVRQQKPQIVVHELTSIKKVICAISIGDSPRPTGCERRGLGTAIGEHGWMVNDIRERRTPIVGGGTGVWSLIHIDAALPRCLNLIWPNWRDGFRRGLAIRREGGRATTRPPILIAEQSLPARSTTADMGSKPKRRGMRSLD